MDPAVRRTITRRFWRKSPSRPWRSYSAGGGLLVNYRQLPDALFTAILPHFGVPSGEADRAAMTQAARYDAKSPGFEFAPDSGAKQRVATPVARAAAERWLGDLYRRLEVLRAEGSPSGVHDTP